MTIRIASDKDLDAVGKLRLQSYRCAKEFVIADEENVKKCRGTVLIAEYNTEIVVTMQMEVFYDFGSLNEYDNQVPVHIEIFPTLFCSRGATSVSFQSTGLNSLLRLYALEHAINNNIKSSTGLIYENAPRVKLLRELGYSFFHVDNKDDFLIGKSECYFIALEENKYAYARSALQEVVYNNKIIFQPL